MNKFKLLICCMIISCGSMAVQAQRNLYHRLDVGSGNVYTFVISNLITGYANYLTHDILFDNSYVYTLYKSDFDGYTLHTKAANPLGLEARELFNDAFCGLKLGYQSDYFGWFNWGLYGSAHYRINQFQAGFDDNYKHLRYQYLKPGLGLLFTFGDIGSPVTVQLEGALRYDIPVGLKWTGEDIADNKLASGLSSHYSLKVAGYSSFSVGVFADINHYNLFKNIYNSSFKPYSFGVTFTITPKRGEDIYDD